MHKISNWQWTVLGIAGPCLVIWIIVFIGELHHALSP